MSFNKLFFPIIAAGVLSQGIKFLMHAWKHKKADLALLVFEPGGMPSTHAAVVTALTTTLYLRRVDTATFAVSLIFSLIVMTDAIGVRREAGETARRMNQLIITMRRTRIEKVHEVFGHTPVQVVAGVILGLVVALFFFSYF